ncbi:MAG: hypothetical protein ACM3Q2_05990 [Syntrophothermus sp.]
MDFSLPLSRLLSDCEKNCKTMAYGSPEVHITSEGKDIYILSDIHLTGENNGENHPSSEEIKTAEIFASFISCIHERHLFNPAILIINGDLFDFLRITGLPHSEAEFDEWQSALSSVGINESGDSLKNSISVREKRYGLSTTENKSVWKLLRVLSAHRPLFAALSDWIGSGNQLIITKGNHDFELYWPAVRNLMRRFFAEIIASESGENIQQVLEEKLFPGLIFADGTLILDRVFYIEHGHRYDKYTRTIGKPVLGGELNTPFGSYFNRYLFNPIERAYPPLKNIHIKGNILQMLIEKRFFMGLRAFLRHIPVLFLVIPFRYYRHLFGRTLLAGFILFLPLLYIMDKSWDLIDPVTMKLNELEKANPSLSRFFRIPGYNLIGSMILSFFSFVVGRSDVYLTIEEQNSLKDFAVKIFSRNSALRLITFGHTHNSEHFCDSGREFFNTGSWIYTGEAEPRPTHTFLHIEGASASDGFRQTRFMKWNYERGLMEPFSDTADTDRSLNRK